MKASSSRLLFFVTVDWFFCSHFLERAAAAKEAGYDVVVLCRVDRHLQVMESAGLRVIDLPINRRSLNPISSLVELVGIYQIYRQEKPDLVHQIGIKPILFGTLAARFAGVTRILNAMVGGGYLFTSQTYLARVLRPFVDFALRLLLNPSGSCVVFENKDDLATFVENDLVRRSASKLICGAGVRLDQYSMASNAANPPIVVLVARLLWDKGIGEFVAAARLLRVEGITARFVIVGSVDSGNRAAIDSGTLAAWQDDGCVEFWGFRTDIPEVLAQASVVCLPSYREGLPKALLEGMASGLPCVTTDVPGCREAVRQCDNGLLVSPRDPQSLAEALKILINDPEMRKRMGLRGRERVEKEFSSEWVIKQTLELYGEMFKK